MQRPDSSSSPRALAALLAGATGIGFAPVLVRLSHVGPSAIAFYRLLFALPLLWLWLAFERASTKSNPQATRQPTITKRDIAAFAIAGIFFTIDLAVWHWSLRFTSVANSTLLANFAPLFVTVGAWFFLHERIAPLFLVGMLIAISGAGLLVSTSLGFSSRHVLGDVLAITAALFYAGYLLSVKNLRTRFSTVTIMAWSGIFSTAGLFAAAVLSHDRLWPPTRHDWLVLIALALVSHLGGQTLIAYAFGHLPASISSLNLLLQPVVAAAAAWIALHEPVTWPQAIGAAVVLVGLLIGNRSRKPALETQPPGVVIPAP